MNNKSDNREVAIRLTDVKKRYKLGQIGGGSLQADIQSWWARIRGKEDPNTKIGTDQRLVGQTFMALNGIDLTVYKGEALGIIGSNGAGKSTMLKLLSRVTAPTSGKIQLYGRIASMLEVGTGFNGEMTGRENIYMNGTILGMTKAEIDAKMEDIIEFSEVREFIDTPVKRYSSGMYVKLAFSVAAHLDSEIMIMDEVLAVGDMAFQKKCLTKMKEAAEKEGRTVLYVSHNMSTIRQLCDRCVVLEKGKSVFEGDVEKAIGIYLNKDTDINTQIDYKDFVRPNWLNSNNIRIEHVKFIGKETNVFIDDETIKLELLWKNLADIDGLCIRWEIIASDGIVVGTSILNNIYSGNSGATGKIHIEYELGELMPGEYHSYITLYYCNEYGDNINLDWVPGLSFVKEFVNKKELKWDIQHWGHIKFKDGVIIK